MKSLPIGALTQIQGGLDCTLHYKAEANANYLPFLSQYLLKLQTNQMTAAQFLQTLTAAGLSPNNLTFEITPICV